MVKKIEILNFRPKIDLRPLGTILWQILVEKLNFRFLTSRVNFCQKIEIFSFRQKLNLRPLPLGTIFWQILVERLNFRFFYQKSIFDLQGPF